MTEPHPYRYRAIDLTGKSRNGTLTARTESEAYARLRADDLTPVSLRIMKSEGLSLLPTRASVSVEALEDLLSGLAVLLR